MEGVQAVMKTRHLEADQWLNRKEWCLGSGTWRQLSQDRKDTYKKCRVKRFRFNRVRLCMKYMYI
jgi:hypothetical protein